MLPPADASNRLGVSRSARARVPGYAATLTKSGEPLKSGRLSEWALKACASGLIAGSADGGRPRVAAGGSSAVDYCLAGFASWADATYRGPFGGGSAELTRDHFHLTRPAEGVGVPDKPCERFGAVVDELATEGMATDEMALRGHPYLAGPAAVAQPTRADGAATRGVRQVLAEQFPPHASDGCDVPAR
jgi:hypothetical protein